MKAGFSVCVLLYGDELRLAERCLNSIEQALERAGPIACDLRLGLNAIGPDTETFLLHRIPQLASRLPVVLYRPDRNVFKYPLMRRMFWQVPEDLPLADRVMWFDDDSYFDPIPTADWWPHLRQLTAGSAPMAGKIYRMGMRSSQRLWITHQSWSSWKTPPRHAFRFCTGGWWVLRTDVLREINWPIPELLHNGGDTMLGERLRHAGYSLAPFENSVRINADNRGRHSKAAPRTRHHLPIGATYSGTALSIDHQEFPCECRVIRSC